MFEIPKLTDLKYRQLLSNARSRAFTESNGELNDFSRHNPLYVLVSTLAITGTEILYFANKFAERLAYKYLSIFAQTDLENGTKGRCQIEINLTTETLLEIPTGTKVLGDYQGETVIFQTLENVIFDGTEISKVTLVEALEVGSRYSIPTGIIDRFIQPISFIDTVTNITPATGVDPITREQATNLALSSLRSRGLVSESDYIFYAQKYAGNGSLASAIPNISADQSRFELGCVHIFLLGSNGLPADIALIEQVKTEIFRNTPPMAGINLYFSPMNVVEIRLDVTIFIDNTVTFHGIAETIYKQLEIYLNSNNHKPGDPFNIRQFESRLWLIPGIINLEPITVNNSNVDITVERNFKLIPQYVSCNIINETGINQTILIGAGESQIN